MPKKLQLLVPLVGPEGPQGPKGDAGSAGKDGATFKPSVTEDGILSWTNDKGLANPTPVAIKNSGIHIGAEEPTNPNANIWIFPDEDVEEPTDDTVCIPAPETAKVGQTIVVKAVDENGKPTEWEAADLPSGVAEDDSFPETPQFDITVEEDCVSVLLETLNDVALSEYGFKSMYIAVNSIAVSTAVSGDLTARVNHKANGTVHPTATVSNFLRQTSSKWWHALLDFKNENVYWLTTAVSRSIDAASSFKRPGCFKKGEHAVMPITNIYVGGTTSCTIPAGTRIYIWLR